MRIQKKSGFHEDFIEMGQEWESLLKKEVKKGEVEIVVSVFVQRRFPNIKKIKII